MLRKLLKPVDRLMARYLESCGWSVFFLEPEHTCDEQVCWLETYRSDRRQRAIKEPEYPKQDETPITL